MDPAFPQAPVYTPALEKRSPLREAITAAWRMSEPSAVQALLPAATLNPEQAGQSRTLARKIATQLRERKASAGRAGIVQQLLQEFALSSQEGVALMCLAEALLRIPDKATRDALIRDKIARGQWEAHLGSSPSLFVNAATWGLLLTGKLVATHSESGLSSALGRLIGKGGEPLIRKGVDMAMRMMGEQFVTGETIGEALKNARPLEAQGFRYSYDMLGEAALTAADAARYRRDYENAIDAIGKASAGRGVINGPGISIKLSALHPRYSRAQYQRVMDELYPVVRDLMLRARSHDIGINIDAEEADRLELSLDLLERLCHEPQLAGWNGIGFVIQGYQKRCPAVIDFVIDLARRTKHRLMIRLVKGAYWDSEIKRAQIDGLDGFPVYTRKPHTDVAYIACAKALLAAPDAVYPQFATHNAQTLSAIYTLADPTQWKPGQYEFQCLHGMGEPLYEQVVGPTSEGKLDRPCRIYAPVGTHETLLAYLVRRLLENGANTSFVNRIADRTIAIDALIQDPVETVRKTAAATDTPIGAPHPMIAAPSQLYGASRRNSAGLDLANDDVLETLAQAFAADRREAHRAVPVTAEATAAADARQAVRNPANPADTVGTVVEASVGDVDRALAAAAEAAPAWAATPISTRAQMLRGAADRLQEQMPQLLPLLAREAGKTSSNAIAEVREAIDFLRYYAAQANQLLIGVPAEPLGPIVCISPWNFPLAIFIGQVGAALVAGNPVLAKPAEQTPLIAAQAVAALHEAGVPKAVLQLLPGRGETVGAALVGDARTRGVMFTGSTAVARILQRTLAGRLDPNGRPIPLVAETGGQNAMIVDSSALTEQVVNDVVNSAFDSAGQRCSALRVLCVQEDSAATVGTMLRGAMEQLRVGDPSVLATDVGPVIDAEARDGINQHIAAMRAKGRTVEQRMHPDSNPAPDGTFVVPTLIELERIDELEREIFGPVLHVVRYKRRDLDGLLGQIRATGYGLTMGLHTRIDETIARVVDAAHAGNVYVNRNMVGAVVGVQPFGGEGLSGTGPKAGGPLYLFRLLSHAPDDAMVRAFDGAAAAATGATPGSRGVPPAVASAGGPTGIPGADPAAHSGVDGVSRAALEALRADAGTRGDSTLVRAIDHFRATSRSGESCVLPGPTGERNVYALHPREAVLCLADADSDRLVQLAAVLAVGSRAVWPASAQTALEQLPQAVQAQVALAQDWTSPHVDFDAVLHHGSPEDCQAIAQTLATREGAIIGLQGLRPGETAIALERLVIERAISINTAAAGGNASLMTIG